jgi:hypothetical protein
METLVKWNYLRAPCLLGANGYFLSSNYLI